MKKCMRSFKVMDCQQGVFSRKNLWLPFLHEDRRVSARLVHPHVQNLAKEGKIHMEPQKFGGLVQMSFLFNWVIFRFHVNFPGW